MLNYKFADRLQLLTVFMECVTAIRCCGIISNMVRNQNYMACVTTISLSNWSLGTDVSKYRQNGLEHRHKRQFSKLSAKHPHFPSTVCAERNMHVFIHWKRNCLAGKLTYREPYFIHKDSSLIWQLWIIPPHPPPLSSFSRSYWSSDCRLRETGSTRTLQSGS